ncbi:hypothetical protein [Humisphaera borealis]|uniref:Uncharacterized protein n=1 Tax=Humisphaera borealis TaxID=2807512 RepID=A0A7M2X214_9BACT|nr:hypothetical protein [Humisphaera borealis]QOV91704.1 hypothetical protein IPV69_10205 [Humisphaera borealis]
MKSGKQAGETPAGESQPESSPPAVLPYHASGRDDYVGPIDEVYGQMGRAALILSLFAASYVIAFKVVSVGSLSVFNGFGICCLGLLPWIVSLTLAIRVSFRQSVGRSFALAALAIDLTLMFAVIWLAR